MKPKMDFHGRWVWIAGLVGGVAIGWGLSAVAQLSRSIKTRDFVYPQYYEEAAGGRGRTNLLKGILRGAEGRYLSNDLIFVTQMELEHYQADARTNLVAHAPECYFDRESQIAWSTGRLEIVAMGGALHLFGYGGFTLNMTNSSLIASNHVRTILRQDLLKSSQP